MSQEYKFIVEGVSTSAESGSKGIFEESVRRFQNQVEVSAEQMTEQLSQFCTSFCDALPKIENSNFGLDEVEIKVELSASGEVKLIGGVSTGITGGINMKFKRKS